MKKLAVCLVVIGMLVLAGQAFAADAVPDLKGTWQSQMEMVDLHGADIKHQRVYDDAQVIIESQQGHAFAGVKVFTHKGKTKKENFSGVIYWDNKTIYIADHEAGIYQGTIESADEVRGVYLEEGKHARAVLTVWKKVK